MDELHLKSGLRSAIRVPLIAKGEVFGSLNLTGSEPDAYNEWHREVLEQLAAQVSGAIDNARLYQLEKTLKENILQFTNAITHEMKTPLTPILSSGKLLVEQLEPKGEVEYRLARNILDGAHTLSNRLNELLELAKGEMGLLKVNPEPLEPGSLIRKLADRWSTMFAAKKQEFRLELEGPLPYVLADEERTSQVLLNLLSNANKFTPEGGQVTLRAKAEVSALVIEVEDNGPGIPPEEQGALFQPYFHPNNFHGLGLGLAISKRLVELQGGKIWCQSQPGRGCTFGFSLPVASSQDGK